MTIGDRIRLARKEKKLTQVELAKKIGESNKQTIYKYEKDKVGVPSNKVEKLATALDVSPAYLMGWNEKMEFSKEQVELDLQISQDLELKEALKIYFSLPNAKKKHIIETIKKISGEGNNEN